MDYELNPGPINQTPGNASKVRPYFSLQHIASAQMFADMSTQIEERYEVHKSMTITESRLHYSFIISAVISSAAFMEARINELFVDAADTEAWTLPGENGPRIPAVKRHRPNPMMSGLSSETVARLARSWKSNIPVSAKYPILEKYQIALMLAYQEIFDPGHSEVYKKVKLLIELRNHLVHAEPEWIVTASPNAKDMKEHKFEAKLKTLFPDNPTVSHERKYFPDRCLGSGCAKWAVASSTNFVDEFLIRIGSTEPKYEQYRQFPCGFSFHVTHDNEA